MIVEKSARRFSPDSAIAVRRVVETFENGRLRDHVGDALKGCRAEKGFVEDVLKTFDDSVAPWFSLGNEDWLDSQVK